MARRKNSAKAKKAAVQGAGQKGSGLAGSTALRNWVTSQLRILQWSPEFIEAFIDTFADVSVGVIVRFVEHRAAKKGVAPAKELDKVLDVFRPRIAALISSCSKFTAAHQQSWATWAETSLSTLWRMACADLPAVLDRQPPLALVKVVQEWADMLIVNRASSRPSPLAVHHGQTPYSFTRNGKEFQEATTEDAVDDDMAEGAESSEEEMDPATPVKRVQFGGVSTKPIPASPATQEAARRAGRDADLPTVIQQLTARVQALEPGSGNPVPPAGLPFVGAGGVGQSPPQYQYANPYSQSMPAQGLVGGLPGAGVGNPYDQLRGPRPEIPLVGSTQLVQPGLTHDFTESLSKLLENQGGTDALPDLKTSGARILMMTGTPPLRVRRREAPKLLWGIFACCSSAEQYVSRRGVKSTRNLREAQTLARGMDLAIQQHGVDFVATDPSWEVFTRRLHALLIADRQNTWKVAEKLEGIPPMYGFDLHPSIEKDLLAQVDLEVKVDKVVKGATSSHSNPASSGAPALTG